MDDTRTARRFRRLAFLTAGLTYALILLGGVVRIMGAGMACGDDWPLCNGRLIPPLELAIWLEWGHRLDAALVTLFVIGLAVYGFRNRRDPVLRSGPWLWALASAVLLVLQVALGAIVVKLELPTGVVVVHLTLASILVAILLIAGLRARPGGPMAAGGGQPEAGRAGGDYRRARIAAGAGFALLVLGGLVANTGAAPLCQGFPLCNGRIAPPGGVLVQLHWIHRLVAYGFILYLGFAASATLRAGPRPAVARAVLAAVALAAAQLAVGAAMVLGGLPTALRAAHLGLGVALWATLVMWAALARPAGARIAVSNVAARAVPATGIVRERPS